jgi:hypothetical protein
MVQRGKHTAQFEEIDGLVKITSVFGTKQTQLGSTPAEVLAGIMLAEQIAEAERKG